MGNVLSTFAGNRGLKRKNDDNMDDESPTASPKRRKTTSAYIFNALYVNGEGSDVTISVLGRRWQLHKIYLKQCAYFNSMFSGSWRESNDSFLQIEIPDPLIDTEAVDIAFQSVYKDDVAIPIARVVSVLAAATLLQLDGLREQCQIIMRDHLKKTTIVEYYSAAQSYGLQEIVDLALSWLRQNLMIPDHCDGKLLSEISVETMALVLPSPNLFVYHVETDVYSLLKKWLFIHLFRSRASAHNVQVLAEQYFKGRRHKTDAYFLETELGRPFLPAFEAVRWHCVINDAKSVRLVQDDQIVPEAWLAPVFRYQWQHLLNVDCGLDQGPLEVEEEVFNKLSSRCGRKLTDRGQHFWRWTGYSHGVDLLLQSVNGLITVKRNTEISHHLPHPVSHQPTRNIMYRITLASLDQWGKSMYHQSSGLKAATLGKDQEEVVLLVSPEITFPAMLSFSVLTHKPSLEAWEACIKIPQPLTHTAAQTELTVLGPNTSSADSLLLRTNTNESSILSGSPRSGESSFMGTRSCSDESSVVGSNTTSGESPFQGTSTQNRRFNKSGNNESLLGMCSRVVKSSLSASFMGHGETSPVEKSTEVKCTQTDQSLESRASTQSDDSSIPLTATQSDDSSIPLTATLNDNSTIPLTTTQNDNSTVPHTGAQNNHESSQCESSGEESVISPMNTHTDDSSQSAPDSSPTTSKRLLRSRQLIADIIDSDSENDSGDADNI